MFLFRPLAPDDEVTGFDCGSPPLNSWLTTSAARAHVQDIVRVYVWVDEDAPHRVVAYAAVRPTRIAARSLTRGEAGGHTTVPAYLIARLALHRDLHGRGLGGELLFRMVEVCIDASRIGGGRVIVVDPIDDAATRFYERFGFGPTKGPDARLVMKVSTAEAALTPER